MTLDHRCATLSIRSYELDRFVDDFRIFFESTVATVVPSGSTFPIAAISLDDRVIVDILEHSRIDRALDMIHDAFYLFCLDEDSLEASRRHRTRREVEHITATEEILGSDLIEDRTGVDIRGDGKGNTRRDIRLDESGDDIDRWSLGCEDEMETDRTCLLGDTSNSCLDFFLVPAHHEVSELIDDDDDHGHSIFLAHFRIVLFEISDAHRFQGTITPFHLSDSPLQSIECLIGSIDDGCEEMRDAIIDPELDLFRINHDHAEFRWSILIEHREDKSVHPHGFPRSRLSSDQEVRHLCEITDDKVPIDILSYGERELRLVMCEAIILEDFTDTDDITFLIWNFDPDESETRDRRLDADGFCLECQREILFQRLDLRESDSLTRAETILDHGRSDTFFFHLDIDPELEKGFLDKE